LGVGVGVTQDIGLLFSEKIVVDVDGVRQVMMNEVIALPDYNFISRICALLSQSDVLQRCQGFPDFLRIVTLRILPASILPLISIRIILSPPLYLILTPSLLFTPQENLLDL
jgi:hypothetical protein